MPFEPGTIVIPSPPAVGVPDGRYRLLREPEVAELQKRMRQTNKAKSKEVRKQEKADPSLRSG